MPIACSSAATVCASKRRRKASPLDRVQSLMERSHPSSGRSATPADINRNGRPTSFGTGGRHQSECPADIIGIRNHLGLQSLLQIPYPALSCECALISFFGSNFGLVSSILRAIGTLT